jgi:hypothetical protein
MTAAAARPARARPSPQPGSWRAPLPCARDHNQPDDANLNDQASAAARFCRIPADPAHGRARRSPLRSGLAEGLGQAS